MASIVQRNWGRIPCITFVAQVVKDIHVPTNLDQVAAEVGNLWASLKDFKFIPKEKVTGDLSVVAVETTSGIVDFELTGSSLGKNLYGRVRQSLRLDLPLGIGDYHGPLDTRQVFEATPGTVIQDGGNVHNMLLDVVVMAAALSRSHAEFSVQNLRLIVASSSDPFRGFLPPSSEVYRERVEVYPLPMPDRLAVLLPRFYGGSAGTLNITSEPALSEQPLRVLLTENPVFCQGVSRHHNVRIVRSLI